MKRAVGVIPARLAATRLPGKPLLEIAGKPMVQWVWERASKAASLDEVVIATPDERIVSACTRFGAMAVLTDPDHPTGSDRVAEAARSIDAEVIVNIQGDEPLTDPDALDALTRGLDSAPHAALGSLMFLLRPDDDAENANLVKVVTDREGYALYFSRSPIPYPRGLADPKRFGHMGVYAWRRDFLLEFTKLPQGELELAESLEQLRALEVGWKIKMVETSARPIGVDTADDLERVRAILGAA